MSEAENLVRNIYDEMWQNTIGCFPNGNFEVDPFVHVSTDTRRGITLIFRLQEDLLENLAAFLDTAKKIEGKQYFYDAQNIHTTVMSIVSCHEGFELNRKSIPEYVELIDACLKDTTVFDIEYTGITASPSCVLAQGFPQGNSLARLRESIRSNFKNSTLLHSIDERYKIQTAHSSLIRIGEELSNREGFLEFLRSSRERTFGVNHVSELMLIYNDWYHKKGLVRELHRFTLNAKP